MSTNNMTDVHWLMLTNNTTNAHQLTNSFSVHCLFCIAHPILSFNSQLFQFMHMAYSTSDWASPLLHKLDNVWDWKSWLENHSHGLTGHSQPHVFHFFRDSSGAPVIQDKAYNSAGAWSSPYQLLSSSPTGTILLSCTFHFTSSFLFLTIHLFLF
jgi:hypothetical protein